MKRISDQTIADVRERTELLPLVEEHVAMRRSGSRWQGLCPFHDERSPSFTVNPATQTFYCYGCQEHGDAIAFLQQIQGEGFRWAVETLANRANITIHDSEGEQAQDDAERAHRARLHEANETAAQFFAHHLLHSDEGDIARQELQRRHLDPEVIAANYGGGYAPNSPVALLTALRSKGFTDKELLDAGLAYADKRNMMRSRFRGRMTWTIRNTFSRAVGFGARRLSDDDPIEAKFINTAETEIYKKSDVLFGYDLARKTIAKHRHAVIVEGYTDVVACHLAGITNAVATCGTSFTDQHRTTLTRIVGDSGEVTFALDDDSAGQKATMKVYDIMKGAVGRLTALEGSGGLDPDEYRQQHGNAALAAIFGRRQPLLKSVIVSTVNSLPLDTPEDRVAALSRVVPLIGHASDPLLRREYGMLTASLLRFPPDEVIARVTGVPAPPRNVTSGGLPSAARGTLRVDPEWEVLRILVLDEAAARTLVDEVRWHLDHDVSTEIAEAIDRAFVSSKGLVWSARVREHCTARAAQIVSQIVTEGFYLPQEKMLPYAREYAEMLVAREAAREKARLREAILSHEKQSEPISE